MTTIPSWVDKRKLEGLIREKCLYLVDLISYESGENGAFVHARRSYDYHSPTIRAPLIDAPPEYREAIYDDVAATIGDRVRHDMLEFLPGPYPEAIRKSARGEELSQADIDVLGSTHDAMAEAL